jgi:hypothetical protein
VRAAAELEIGRGLVLQQRGANGIASIVAALFYWGTTLGDHREDSLGWSRAVEDVDWVLQQL